METVQAYRASNGQLFETIEKCEECEVSILWRERIAEYIASDYCNYKGSPHRGMCSRIVLSWEQFKSREQLNET